MKSSIVAASTIAQSQIVLLLEFVKPGFENGQAYDPKTIEGKAAKDKLTPTLSTCLRILGGLHHLSTSHGATGHFPHPITS